MPVLSLVFPSLLFSRSLSGIARAHVLVVSSSEHAFIQVNDILLHPAATKAIIAAISPPPDNSPGISEQALANISQMLADHMTSFEIYHEERFSVFKYILSLSRSSLPLQSRLSALSASLRARFLSCDRRPVYAAADASLTVSIDREDVLGSAIRHLGRVPISVLLQRSYRIEFNLGGAKEDGSDYGGLRRSALVLMAKEVFSEANGYTCRCLSDDGEHSGLLQVNSSRRTVESQEGREVFKLMGIRTHTHTHTHSLSLSLSHTHTHTGRLIGLALCENIPLGIPLTSGFFKLLASEGLFPEPVVLEDLKEMDQALHRSLAVALPSMQESELREALSCMTFTVPSRTQTQRAVSSSRASSSFEPTSDLSVQSPLRTVGLSQPDESPLRPGGAEQAVTPGGFEEYR